jgi:hypothetical protein
MILSSKSYAFDNCTRQIPGALVTNKFLVSSYVITQPTERELQETFKLKTGQEITILHSGCTHFGLTYKATFSDLPKNQVIGKAVALLKEKSEDTQKLCFLTIMLSVALVMEVSVSKLQTSTIFCKSNKQNGNIYFCGVRDLL